jgi:hypothetical protein
MTGIAVATILALELEAFISGLLDRPSLKYMLLLGEADLTPISIGNKNATIIHVMTQPVGAGSKKRSFDVGKKDGELFWYSFFGSNRVTRKVAGCPSYDIERRRSASDFKMMITLESVVEEGDEEEDAHEIEDGVTDMPTVAKTVPTSEPNSTTIEASCLAIITDPISVPVLRRSARLAGKRAAALLEPVSADAGEHISSSVLGSRIISGRRRSARLVSHTPCMS